MLFFDDSCFAPRGTIESRPQFPTVFVEFRLLGRFVELTSCSRRATQEVEDKRRRLKQSTAALGMCVTSLLIVKRFDGKVANL